MKRELRAIERILTSKKANATVAARELAASEQGRGILTEVARATWASLRLARDEREVGILPIVPAVAGVRFPRIVPGSYVLSMSSGRELWRRTLTAADVISAVAFRDTALPAAAQTGSFDQKPTVTEVVADGALTVSVFAGVESGTLICHLALWK